MSEFVTLKDVKKIYQMGEVEIMAAAGIDFEIKKGEMIGIVGASGTGKSTLLRMIAGDEVPDSGNIIRQNQLKLAWLPQEPKFPDPQNHPPRILRAKDKLPRRRR